MKIVSIISGLLVAALMILLFTGVINFNGGTNEFIKRGNKAYATNNYQQALETYQKGLNKDSDEPKLNYNSGQASYQLGNYGEAIEYYAKTDSSPDKYINSGNSSLKLAEASSDPLQKQQLYQQALETYKNGILAYPENIPLKYNYEYVKSKLDDNQDQNNEQQDNNENQENEEDQNNNQDQQGDNSQQNQQNKDSSENNQDESSDQKDSEKDQQSSQDNDGNEQNNSQDEENKEQNSSQANESDSSNADQEDSNVAQILKMLEKQEQESLKNNQEVRKSTKEDEYDW